MGLWCGFGSYSDLDLTLIGGLALENGDGNGA
jgi:hypothetical protein